MCLRCTLVEVVLGPTPSLPAASALCELAFLNSSLNPSREVLKGLRPLLCGAASASVRPRQDGFAGFRRRLCLSE